jgi:membrane-associated phospholipid phosphatase
MRASECVVALYFVYTSVLALTLPLGAPVPAVVSTLNLAVLASYALLAWADSYRRGPLLGALRDWYPFPLLLLAYREMGWFAQPIAAHPLENVWVRWDHALLAGGLRAAVECLGPVIPALLEACYMVVYALGPAAMGWLYLYRRRSRAEGLLFTLTLAVLLSYAQFPWWPSEPPRTVFPGADLPAYTSLFRRFNWWYLAGQGIHTSVFPSAHVSGAFGTAFAMIRTLPEHPWVGRALLVMAVLIAAATVYGRYHYFADAAAGFGVALVALGISEARRRLRH